MKFLRKYSLSKRINLLTASIMGPLTVLVLYLLVNMINFSTAYNQSVKNITVIKDYSLNFKTDLDYSIYRAIVGNLALDDLDEYAKNSNSDSAKVRNPYKIINEMRNAVKRQETESGKNSADLMRRISKSLGWLERVVRKIDDNIQEGGHYAENIELLDKDIRSSTQLIQDNLGICIFFQFYNHTDAFTVGFIPQVRNAFYTLVLDQLSNRFHQPGLIDAIGDFGCYNAGSAMGHFFKMGTGTHFQLAPTGGISSTNTAASHNQTAGWEIRSFDVLTDFIQTCFRIVNDMADAVNHFGQVMGRHVGSHTDGNAGGAVDQHTGETGGQNGRFLTVIIEVRHELDGILVNIGHHMGSQLAHAGFRVTVSSRWVAIQRAKVAMTVNHGIAQGKPLCHTHHGIINGGITMGMIPA